MSSLQLIEETLQRTVRRMRLERTWQSLWRGFLFGAALFLVVFVTYKIAPIPVVAVSAAALAGLLVTLTFGIVAACRKISSTDAARFVDSRKQLKERLSTALEISRSASGDAAWRDLVIADAAAHVNGVEPRKLIPLSLPALGRWALLLAVLAAGLGFIPEYRTKTFVERKAEQANIKETGKQLAALTRQNLVQHPPV